jgi:hypothetical protein
MDAIVIDGERQFDQWLADIGRLRQSGQASDSATWPLVRLEHTVVIYDMMMKGLLEKMGVVKLSTGGCGGRPGPMVDPPGVRRT